MHVSLLFPPITDPRSPHLALPSLAAVLRGAGVETSMHDLDLGGLLALIQPDSVRDAVAACERRLRAATDPLDQAQLSTAVRDADWVLERIAAAPSLLRDPATFYQPHRFHGARETIGRALSILSAASGSVTCSTGPVSYEVEGVDPAKLADLARVTADPRLNLYHRYYSDTAIPAIERDNPDVVGIAILNYQQVLPGLMLARMLKQRGLFVVIGGTVYSKFVPQLLQQPEFFRLFCDGVVAYEGETALLALLDELAGARDLSRVPNLLSLDAHGRPVIGPTHVEDVNALPTPDFAGLPLADYLSPEPVLPILTGKGCYFNRCKFCDIPFINTIAGKAYRVRRPELIAADVATLQRRHGARHFEITDEALAPRLLLHLADALDDHPDVKALFVGYARLESGFTPEVCRRIHEMGMRKLFFGLESGAQAVLDHMDKGIKLDVAARVLRNCRDAGIGFHLFSIVGFPEETEAQARETLQFFLDHRDLIDHPANSFDVHPFTLDLRTEYADEPERFGVVIDQDDLAARQFPLSVEAWTNTRGLDPERKAELIAEFHQQLRLAYPDYRAFPAHLWPSFEEYAVQYAGQYEQQPFAYRMTLPPPADPTLVQLVWAEGLRIEPDGDRVALTTLTSGLSVPRAALHLLAEPLPPLPVDDLLRALARRSGVDDARLERVLPGLRGLLDTLLTNGILILEPQPQAATRTVNV